MAVFYGDQLVAALPGEGLGGAIVAGGLQLQSLPGLQLGGQGAAVGSADGDLGGSGVDGHVAGGPNVAAVQGPYGHGDGDRLLHGLGGELAGGADPDTGLILGHGPAELLVGGVGGGNDGFQGQGLSTGDDAVLQGQGLHALDHSELEGGLLAGAVLGGGGDGDGTGLQAGDLTACVNGGHLGVGGLPGHVLPGGHGVGHGAELQGAACGHIPHLGGVLGSAGTLDLQPLNQRTEGDLGAAGDTGAILGGGSDGNGPEAGQVLIGGNDTGGRDLGVGAALGNGPGDGLVGGVGRLHIGLQGQGLAGGKGQAVGGLLGGDGDAVHQAGDLDGDSGLGLAHKGGNSSAAGLQAGDGAVLGNGSNLGVGGLPGHFGGLLGGGFTGHIQGVGSQGKGLMDVLGQGGLGHVVLANLQDQALIRLRQDGQGNDVALHLGGILADGLDLHGMRLVDILGGDLTGGGDGGVSAVGAIHQPEGNAGNRGLHRLGGSLQGQGLPGAQDGALRLGNGNGLGQAAHLDLHGGGLPAAVGGGSGNGHGALTGHVGDHTVLYGQDLGVGGLPAQALNGIGGIELTGEGQGLLGVHIHVEGLAVDDLAASQDLHLGDGGIDGDGVLDGGGAVLGGPHKGHIVPGGNRVGLHGTGRGDGSIGCVLGIPEGPGDAVLGDGVALGIHSLQGGGLAANQPGIHMVVDLAGFHSAHGCGILAQQVVGAVQRPIPAEPGDIDGRQTVGAILGVDVVHTHLFLMLRGIGIHILHLADGMHRRTVVDIAGNIVVAVQALQEADDSTCGLAVGGGDGCGNGIVLDVQRTVGEGLENHVVAALDAAHLIGAGDGAGDGAVLDGSTLGVEAGGIGIAAAQDTAGHLAGGLHSAVKGTILEPEGRIGVVQSAHNTAYIILAVNGSVALTALDGTDEPTGEGADHGFLTGVADDYALFRYAIPDGDQEVAGAAGEGVGGDVGADEAGLQGLGAGLQGDTLNGDGVAGKADALQVVHQAVALDLRTVDAQVSNVGILHVAQQRQAAFGHGEGVALAIQMAAEAVAAVRTDGLPALGQGHILGLGQVLILEGVSGSNQVVNGLVVLSGGDLVRIGFGAGALELGRHVAGIVQDLDLGNVGGGGAVQAVGGGGHHAEVVPRAGFLGLTQSIGFGSGVGNGDCALVARGGVDEPLIGQGLVLGSGLGLHSQVFPIHSQKVGGGSGLADNFGSLQGGGAGGELQQVNDRLLIAGLGNDTDQLRAAAQVNGLGSLSGGHTLVVDIDVLRLAGNRDGHGIHRQGNIVDLLAVFRGDGVGCAVAGEGDGGGGGSGAHIASGGAGPVNSLDLGGLLKEGTGHDVGGGDDLHIVEGLAVHVYGSTVGVHGPGQVETGALQRQVIVGQVGVRFTVYQSIRIAKGRGMGKAAGGVSADHAIHSGNQNAGQGDGVAVYQRIERVVRGKGPTEGLAMIRLSMAVVIGPGCAGAVSGVGNGVVPDGAVVVLGACQGIPVAAILGDPDLTGLGKALARVGVAIHIEVHAVLVGGIVAQAVLEVEGSIAAEAAQGLEGAAEHTLRGEAVGTAVGVLAVDGQVIHNLVRAVLDPLGGGEGVFADQAAVGVGDGNGLIAGSQLQRVGAGLVSLDCLGADLDGIAFRYGEGNGGQVAVLGNAQLIGDGVGSKGGIPVAGVGGGGEDLGLTYGRQLLHPHGVGSTHLGGVDHQLFLVGSHFREGKAALSVVLVPQDLEDDLHFGMGVALSLGEGDDIGQAAALRQLFPGLAVVDGVTDVGIGRGALDVQGEVGTTVHQVATVVVLGVADGVVAVLNTSLAGLEQVALSLVQIQAVGQSAALGILCGNAVGVGDGLVDISGAGDLQGVDGLDILVGLIRQRQRDQGGAEGHTGQLGLLGGRNGNADSFAVFVGIGGNAVQLLRVVAGTGVDGEDLGIVVAQLNAGVILLVCLVLEGGGSDAVEHQLLEGGILAVGNHGQDAALGAVVVNGRDLGGADGMGSHNALVVHSGHGLIGTGPGGNAAALFGDGLQLHGGRGVLGGQLQIGLTKAAVGVLQGHTGDIEHGGIGELRCALRANVQSQGDLYLAGTQDIHAQRSGLGGQIRGDLRHPVGILHFPDVVAVDAADNGSSLYGLAVGIQPDGLVLVVIRDLVELNVDELLTAGHAGIQSRYCGHIGVAGGGNGVDTGFGIQLAAVGTADLPDDGGLAVVFVQGPQLHLGALLDSVGHTAVGIGAGVGNRIGIVGSQGKALGHRLDGDLHHLTGGAFQAIAGGDHIIIEGAQLSGGNGEFGLVRVLHSLASLGGGGGIHIPLIADGGVGVYVSGNPRFHSQGVLGVLSDGQRLSI